MGRSFERWLWAVGAGWILLSGGCAAPTSPRTSSAPPPGPPNRQPGPQTREAAPGENRFIVAPELEGLIRVTRIGIAHPPGKLLKVQVNAENLTGAPQHFVYRILWFDKDGQRIPIGGDSVPWMLLPKEEAFVEATAPAVTAEDFGVVLFPTTR